MNSIKKWGIILLLLISGILLLQGCNRGQASDEQEDRLVHDGKSKKTNVVISTIKPSLFISHLVLVGEVESVNDATLSGQVAATLREIRADKGTIVEEGDTILILDDRRMSALYQMAESRLLNAKLDYNIAEKQHNQGLGVSDAQFQKIANGLKAAEAEAANAKIDLDNCYVLAPFGGIVAERYIDKGELVNPGAPLIRLVDNHTLRVKAGVPENQSAAIRNGSKAVVQVKAMNLEITGKISFVGAALDPRSRTLPIEVVITSDSRLKPGMVTEVVLEKSRKSDAIVIPLSILQKAPDHFFVYMYMNGKAVYRPVVAGEKDGELVVITEGLDLGDELITEGYRDLIDGQEVTVVGKANR